MKPNTLKKALLRRIKEHASRERQNQNDNLKKKYDHLLSKNPELKKYDDLGIGTTPSSKFKKFYHFEPMLSLSNSFSVSDSEEFFDKASNFLKKQNSNYIFKGLDYLIEYNK